MRNFQQNLLIALALGLCGLCVWQWTDQAAKRRAVEERNQTIYARDAAIQGYTNTIAAGDRQIADLQQRVTELKQTNDNNAQVMLDQRRQITRLQADGDTLTNQLAQYKAAVTNLEGKLTSAYDGIEKQNAAIQQLVAQRDLFIGKFTNSVNSYNGMVKRYNDLVDRVKKMQAAAQSGGGQ